jgi:hypothetical protein
MPVQAYRALIMNNPVKANITLTLIACLSGRQGLNGIAATGRLILPGILEQNVRYRTFLKIVFITIN